MKQLVGRLRVDNDRLAAYARPHDPADYERPELDGSGPATTDIPLDGTKPDASWDVWPTRTLDGCREPLVADGPDLRGVWEVYEGRMRGHVERIEQAGRAFRTGHRRVVLSGRLSGDRAHQAGAAPSRARRHRADRHHVTSSSARARSTWE